MSNWYVYILECSDKSLYTGITNDLEKRINTHNKGKGAKYTKPRVPVELKKFWEVESRSEASKLEYKIKQLKRIDKLKLINMNREEKMETVVRLLSKSMFHGDWEWESPNERTLEMLMRELGYWPYENEDDMISKTKVNEELYTKAMSVIPTRVSLKNDSDGIETMDG